MAIAVVRVTLRDDVDLEEFGKFEEKMIALGSSMPGFQEIKEFKADDGESMMLVTFQTRADMIGWRDHPDHKRAQQRGRERYFTKYDVKICEAIQHYSYSDGKRTEHKM
ncbi:MAG: antibiotic biosynthesis monooxygenase family protein [Planctomycetota bacterium]|jgi:heme-degrading monooxygenase HmoA